MKKNILVFTTTFPTFLEGDGTPPFVYELSKRLAKKEDIHIIVLTSFRKGTRSFEERDRLKIYRFKYIFTALCEGGILPNLKKNRFLFFQIPFLLFFAFINLAKVVKKENINIIHAHWIIPKGFIAVLYKKIFRKKSFKIICTSHGGDIFGLQNSFMKKIKKWTLNNVDRLTVVSNAIKDEVKKLNIRGDLPIEVISMGVDSELFNPNKYDPKIKEKYNIEGPFLLFVGRLAPEKGIQHLIQAMPETIKRFPRTKLLIIGEGTLKPELKELTKKLNLQDNVLFLGKIENKRLPKYYATADIFISPSLREGMPVSYIEAMACGKPLLVGNLPISREIIKPPLRGLLVKQRNKKDISNKIIYLLKNEALLRKMGESSIIFVRENYTWSVISKKYKEILKK